MKIKRETFYIVRPLGGGGDKLRLWVKATIGLLLFWVLTWFCDPTTWPKRALAAITTDAPPAAEIQKAKATEAIKAATPQQKEEWLADAEAICERKIGDAFGVKTLEEAKAKFAKANGDFLALDAASKIKDAKIEELSKRLPTTATDELKQQLDGALKQAEDLTAQNIALKLEVTDMTGKLEAEKLLAPGRAALAKATEAPADTAAARIAAAQASKTPAVESDHALLEKEERKAQPATPKGKTPRKTLTEQREGNSGTAEATPRRASESGDVRPTGSRAAIDAIVSAYNRQTADQPDLVLRNRGEGMVKLKNGGEPVRVQDIYRAYPNFKFKFNQDFEQEMSARYR